jgi:hypothetical protein
MPRWVKGLVVIVIVMVIVLAVLLLAGGQEHGPGRHSAIERSQWS